MTVEKLLEHCEKRGVRVYVEDGKLRYNAPKGTMTDGAFQALLDHKDALLRHLTARAADPLTVHAALIASAEQGELPERVLVRLGSLCLTTNANRCVLLAADYLRYAAAEGREQQQLWREVAARMAELLRNCAVAVEEAEHQEQQTLLAGGDNPYIGKAVNVVWL